MMATAMATAAAPKLVWLNPRHDFGVIREVDGLVDCTFLAVNVGDEPAVVVDARANCGCTQPRYPREPIAPGDTLRLSVSFNPEGRPGKFSKQVKVSANTGTTALLGIRGTVIGSPATLDSRFPESVGPFRFSGRLSAFGETVKGRVLAAAVNLYNTTDDTIVPAVEKLPPYINALIRPEVVPPGQQATVSLTGYTDRTDEYGMVEGSFLLLPDKNQPDLKAEIQTVMIVNEDFSKLTPKEREEAPKASVSEKSVDFGQFSKEDKQLRQTFEIKNTGRSPLIVRKLTSTFKAVTVTTPTGKIKPGKSVVVTVTVDPSLISGNMLNSRLTLVTNDPDNSSQTIRVVGEIKQ